MLFLPCLIRPFLWIMTSAEAIGRVVPLSTMCVTSNLYCISSIFHLISLPFVCFVLFSQIRHLQSVTILNLRDVR